MNLIFKYTEDLKELYGFLFDLNRYRFKKSIMQNNEYAE